MNASTLTPSRLIEALDKYSVVYKYDDEKSMYSNFYGPLEEKVILSPEFLTINDIELNVEKTEFDYVTTAFIAWQTLDINERKKLEKMTPWQAVEFAKSITIRPDISDKKLIKIMHDLIWQKFICNDELLEKIKSSHANIVVDSKGVEGAIMQNNCLGRIIMIVRLQGMDLCPKVVDECRKAYGDDLAFLWD